MPDHTPTSANREDHPSWIVLKYGGTSVATVTGWDRIAERIRAVAPRHRVCVVVSALATVTDRLERAVAEARDGNPSRAPEELRDLHHTLAAAGGLEGDPPELAPLWSELAQLLDGVRLTGEASPRLTARVMAMGERASSRLGAALLAARGVTATWLDATEVMVSAPRPMETDHSRYLDAEIPGERDPGPIERATQDASVILTQGFLARTDRGETCLLGRGGSDTSAALFAVRLGAERLEIWTDVHGMFTADPSRVPAARLIRRIGYREAQELATMGAKVLHPRCLIPAARHEIPVRVARVQSPEIEGTRVEAEDDTHAAVTAVTCRTGVTLVNLSSLAMWGTPGYLARVFEPFRDLGISVDLVTTSEFAVSVTLDTVPGGLDGRPFGELVRRLETLGTVRVVHPAAVVSIIGRRIRAVLHELGPAFEAFQEHPVHLVSVSAEDLNVSFVVDEGDAQPLVARLHARLFSAHDEDPRLGPTWEMLQGERGERRTAQPWWRDRREELLALAADGRAHYVYDLAAVRARAGALRDAVRSVDCFYYAMKANAHPEVLRALAETGFGLECVSAAEVERARAAAGPDHPVLFTPNFCPPEEYAAAFEAGAEVTVDGPAVLETRSALFRGRAIALRLDPGRGFGHHPTVRTAGARAKFGQPMSELDALAEAASKAGAEVIGLHAHVGSGIFDPGVWLRTGTALAEARERFPGVRWLDLGGGLGVPERPGQPALDLAALQARLEELRELVPGLEIRLEPGRYLVSEAGVLIAPVTQVRTKEGVHYAGLATGMNSLLRPALYGAWHTIHNLSRPDAPAGRYWQVVGPICESGDVLGRDRWLPDPEPGDVLLIENAGAYGAVMGSHYNLREPASEVVLG
jgi:diaminopimelate decarboxylase/aspartate kinase